jgi:hypothetical protein
MRLWVLAGFLIFCHTVLAQDRVYATSGKRVSNGVCSVPLLSVPLQPTEKPIVQMPESHTATMPELQVPAPACGSELASLGNIDDRRAARTALRELQKHSPIANPPVQLSPIPEFRVTPSAPRKVRVP